VKNEYRGTGLGKRIMTESECYARKKGFKVMYLNTKDKEAFYRHLGYEPAEAITCLGDNSNRLTAKQVRRALSASFFMMIAFSAFWFVESVWWEGECNNFLVSLNLCFFLEFKCE